MTQTAITFHNKTNEQGATLKKYIGKARTQDQDVLNYFQANPANDAVTPEKVLCYLQQVNPRQYDHPNMIISIRRSFNTLMNLDKIEKTGERVPGASGRSVNAWRVC